MDSITLPWKLAVTGKMSWSQIRQKLFGKLEIAIYTNPSQVSDILFLYQLTFAHQWIEFEKKRAQYTLIEISESEY